MQRFLKTIRDQQVIDQSMEEQKISHEEQMTAEALQEDLLNQLTVMKMNFPDFRQQIWRIIEKDAVAMEGERTEIYQFIKHCFSKQASLENLEFVIAYFQIINLPEAEFLRGFNK